MSSAAVPYGTAEGAGEPAVDVTAIEPARPASGSMEAELLNTTEANRVQMLTLAISDADYDCPPGASARAAGSSGAVWRVHCGESKIYWVEVSEFGRLLVRPLPYGDFFPGTGVEPELRFERQDRTLIPVEPR